ncbi:TPA: hypothetical protein R3965_004381 [Salmonella enterica subsp. enterica serovar Mississippi]|nr:hypothetical protein [Salmonella enterica]EEP7894510.1 hypothetical protein [Salmonella enterica]HEC7438689.1 hypothetical protein [Salmonella enterica subsp. enterica serovar Mississippi]HEC7464721.1 hypothetical protein [Salmonella enterica subsp. enterica serovar Mississippi]
MTGSADAPVLRDEWANDWRDILCPEPVCRARTDTGRAVFPLLSGVTVILRHPLAF